MTKLTPYPVQAQDIKRLTEEGMVALLNMEPGYGKAQPNSEPVLMADGTFKPMGEVRKGDLVVGSQGGAIRVVSTHPQGAREIVKVWFNDGTYVRCDWDHLWTVQTYNQRLRGRWKTATIRELAEYGFRRGGKATAYLPILPDIPTPEKTYEIEPYALGVLLGDGSLAHHPALTTDEEIQRTLNLRWGAVQDVSEGVKTWNIRGLISPLKKLGLSGKRSYEKHIPAEYLTGSRAQRIALLQGLMDTDGTVSRSTARGNRKAKGVAQFNTSSPELANGFRALVATLGGTTSMAVTPEPRYTHKGEKRTGRPAYLISMRLPHDVRPFRLARKAEAYIPNTKYRPTKYITHVEVDGVEEATCIRVDAADSLYVTRNYTITHNTLVAIEAALRTGTGVNLVIAPLSTHESAWGQTLLKQSGVEIRVLGTKNKSQAQAVEDFTSRIPGWYICTPQWFTRADILGWTPDLAIVDEVHMLGNPEGKGAKQLTLLGQQTGYKLALSGTPARNKFERMWTIMRFLWPDNPEIARENYYGWLAEHMLYAKVFIGLNKARQPKYAKKYIRERNPGALIRRAPLVLQHFRREHCCEFHPEGFLSQEEPQVLTRTIPLSPKQKKSIKELEEQYLTWLDDNPLVVEIPLTLQQRVRQMCLAVPVFNEDDEITFTEDMESPFADEMERDLEALDESEPVVVFVESQRFASALTKRLVSKGYSAFEYSGATTKTRAQNLKTFGTPEGHRILVGVLSAIGTGTDGLQKVAQTEFWMERSTDETVNTQGEGRLDRVGARGQIQRYYYQDDLGYAAGRFSKQVEAAMQLRKSLVKEVA